MQGEGMRAGDLAARTGVTVRTLRHYHAIGLLLPAGRSEGGHRRYGPAELLRLQQILTLRFLGFGLGQIAVLLARPDFDAAASLRAQRRAIRARQAALERLDGTLVELLASYAGGGWDWEAALQAAAAAQQGLEEQRMSQDRLSEMYTPEQMQQFAALGAEIPAEEIARVEQAWPPLLAAVRAAREQRMDPTSPKAAALLTRWDELTAATMAGFAARPELAQAIGDNYRQGTFEGFAGAPQATDFAFIEQVRAAQR